MRVVSGMINHVRGGGEFTRDGAKLAVAFSAKVMKREIARRNDARRSGCSASELACSIAANAPPLLRLRSATSAARCAASREAEDRLLIPVGKDLGQRLAAKAFSPGGIAAPAQPTLVIIPQARMPPSTTSPQSPSRGWLT